MWKLGKDGILLLFNNTSCLCNYDEYKAAGKLVTSNRNSFLKNHWFEELGKTKIVQRYYFDKWSQIKHWQHWVNIEINVKYSYQYSSTIKESIVLYYSLILLRVISVWFCQKFSTNIRISKLAKVYYFSFFSLHV